MNPPILEKLILDQKVRLQAFHLNKSTDTLKKTIFGSKSKAIGFAFQ